MPSLQELTITLRPFRWLAGIHLNREKIIWLGLVLAALISRLAQLGERGMSHDESLHAYYSYLLADQKLYAHDPMMHGPLLFHLNALIYWLTGHASDFNTRFLPALAGTCTVASMWWYRRFLGRIGALAAAAFLLVSPSLLFYSRYIRNDIYVILFAIGWIYCLFRYIESGRSRWMLSMSIAMVLGFTSKENHFITGVMLGSFAVGMGAYLTHQFRGAKSPTAGRYWDTAVTMICLVLPFLAPAFLLPFARSPVPVTPEEHWLAGAVAAALALAALAVSYLWFERLRPQHWRGEFGFRQFFPVWMLFWIVAFLLFSTFMTNTRGLSTGVIGSLGYWLSQQDVQRGSQPWYYYFMLTAFYEYLPLLLALLGGFISLQTARKWLRMVSETAAANSAQFPILLQVPLLLCWWTLFSWVSYSFAGERMPWLLSHIAAPMCILAGFGTANLISQLRANKTKWWGPSLLLGLSFTCGIALASYVPFQGRELQAVLGTVRWLTLLAGGVLSLVLAIRALRSSGTRLLHSALLASVIPLGLLTTRTSYQLTFINFDYVTEYLMYAHASPDVKSFLTELEVLGEELGVGKNLHFAYDNENSWPLAWYFRNYENAQLYEEPDSAWMNMEFPVIVSSLDKRELLHPLVGRNYVSRTYRLIWWPEESYKSWSLSSIRNFLDPAQRRRFSRVFFMREHEQYDLHEWPFRKEFDVYVRNDLAPSIWGNAEFLNPLSSNPPAEPEEIIDLPLKEVLKGTYAGLPISNPRSITVSGSGHRVITDSGNHRVLILDSENQLLLAVGSFCNIENVESDSCIDPDGNGPLSRGDGQFFEPWGAAEGLNGDLFVADTWNHRIQIFDAYGDFKAKWGFFGLNPPAGLDGAYSLWGPRGLTTDSQGRLVVADTGNSRILSFTPSGDFDASWSGEDTALGYLREPVDVTRDLETGALYLTDSWNGRIQKVSQDYNALAEFQVPPSMWISRGALYKPYIAVIPSRGAVTSDPAAGRLVFFDQSGTSFGSMLLPMPGNENDDRKPVPLGVAVDQYAQELLVADQGLQRILVYDLSNFIQSLEQQSESP